jgi:DNA-binding transcriptional LysR family regulator
VPGRLAADGRDEQREVSAVNIDVLRTFVELVETGSFSKTAETSYISQSAVSQQLAKLEKALSVQLLSRGGGVVAPTEAGKVFYQGAGEIIERWETLLGEVRAAAQAVRGVLRVGTIYSVGFYLLDSLARRFLGQHAEVSLHVEYTKWNRIYSAVISGEMDLGLVACPEKNRSLEIIPLTEEDLVLATAPEHPLASAQDVDPKLLADEPFIAFEDKVPTRMRIDRLLKDHGVRIDPVMEFDNIELLKRAVEVNAGVAILPLDNIIREVERGEIAYARIRDGEVWTRPVAVVRRRGKAQTPAERKFLAVLRSIQEG